VYESWNSSEIEYICFNWFILKFIKDRLDFGYYLCDRVWGLEFGVVFFEGNL
jgi:hypothetical protein